ncbi:MAG: hypoxanthine phosphoribosyltransferase [Proteobacteria bacterium]|nr:hypoxanthine phosphoribosyltransferase [Pseudomonadota bacterium]
MDKVYISAQQLLKDSFSLAIQIFESGYQPDYIVGVWRGGAPVGIAVQELLLLLGVKSDHIAIRTSSYTGIGQRSRTVKVHGLAYIAEKISTGECILLVDDVYDTGLSLKQVIADIETLCVDSRPEIRIATPWFKPGNNQTNRSPDYHIHESEHWLVFPHELAGLSLEEIRRHKPELAEHINSLELSLKPAD